MRNWFSRRPVPPVDVPSHLHVYLIKPSKYDDHGYVIRYLRGVLPSNTLACLHSLTEEVARLRQLGDSVKLTTTIIDETVQKVPVRSIIARARRSAPGTRSVIALAGVQTNQFPRARDLALRFTSAGLPVMVGGFHVSGTLALLDHVPAHLQELMDRGVTLVKGEVEETWGSLLGDVLHGRLRPLYDFLDQKPDLQDKPIPRVNREYMRRFVFSGFGTIDAGRGCPFGCSFCTIINVQGRTMRHRSAALIEERIREDYRTKGVRFYFITDDNFARNKNWEPIMDTFLRLRRDEGMQLEFMMQVDVQSYKIPGFIDKAKDAGCSNVFIGMESINSKNLEAVGKTQNDVDDFKNLIAAWHNAGIMTHVGYIVGFPHDSPESIREDIRRLKEEVRPDIASFFVLTPLPGSVDHLHMVQAGIPIESDYNAYDSNRQTIPHPNFAPGELDRVSREAWLDFYSTDNMTAVLQRSHRGTYWDIFKNYVWYKNALNEGQHPMISGFLRLKDRTDRRPGSVVEGRWAHLRMRVRDAATYLWMTWGLILEMEEVWLRTRNMSWKRMDLVNEWQHRVASRLVQIREIDYREIRQRLIESLLQFRGNNPIEFRQHLDTLARRIRDFDARQALQDVGDQIASIQQQIDMQNRLRGYASSAAVASGRIASWFRSLGTPAIRIVLPGTTTREPIARFWQQVKDQVRRGQVLYVDPFRCGWNLVRDARLLFAFAINMAVAKFRYRNLGT